MISCFTKFNGAIGSITKIRESQLPISILQSICFSTWQQDTISTVQHGMSHVSIANKGTIVPLANKSTNSMDKDFFIYTYILRYKLYMFQEYYFNKFMIDLKESPVAFFCNSNKTISTLVSSPPALIIFLIPIILFSGFLVEVASVTTSTW